MKVFLDDEREAPNGYLRTYTASETIEILKSGNVLELSLDHDLGELENVGTGYDVILWIEENVVLHDFIPPKIKVHSSNSSARVKMMLGVESIERFMKLKNNP